ncbi:MAG: DUF4382 domain-containing protein, partial [Methanomicrobiales archaeon]|nr:DUF4382 domain-containing protein [Methanomicrobiales archaeon]
MKFTYIALVVVVLASVIMAGCITTPVGQSTLIIAVKDAPKTTDIGNISALVLNISEVSVHQSNQTIDDTEEEMTATESEDTGTAGWIVVVNETQTVELIHLTENVSQVLGQKTLDPGN